MVYGYIVPCKWYNTHSYTLENHSTTITYTNVSLSIVIVTVNCHWTDSYPCMYRLSVVFCVRVLASTSYINLINSRHYALHCISWVVNTITSTIMHVPSWYSLIPSLPNLFNCIWERFAWLYSFSIVHHPKDVKKISSLQLGWNFHAVTLLVCDVFLLFWGVRLDHALCLWTPMVTVHVPATTLYSDSEKIATQSLLFCDMYVHVYE